MGHRQRNEKNMWLLRESTVLNYHIKTRNSFRGIYFILTAISQSPQILILIQIIIYMYSTVQYCIWLEKGSVADPVDF
jgi:hypothetical protein